MDIAEVREKFPQYDDLSDRELVEAIHSAYYSDMPLEDFAARAGLSAEPQPTEEAAEEEPSIIDRIPPIPGPGGIPVGAALEMAQNAPGSLMNVVGETAGALLNPIDTGRAAMGLLQGGADWLGRQAIESRTGEEYAPTDDERSLGALGQYYGDRYGGPMAIEETLREDPVGALMDIPLPTGAMPARAAAINPVRGAARGASRLLDPVADRAIRRDFVSDIKIPPSTPRAQRRQMIDTAMQEGIDVSQGGLDRLQDLIGQADEGVARRIQNVDADLDVYRPLYKLDEQRGRARSNLATGSDDLAAIDRVESQLLDNIERTGSETLTPSQMNEFKRDLYRDIDWDDKKLTAQNQALKAVAKGAKESLEALDPELAAINQRWGRMIDLEEPLARALNRIDNRHTHWWEWGGPIPLMMAGARAAERNINRIPGIVDNPAIGALSEIGWLEKAVEEGEANVPRLYD